MAELGTTLRKTSISKVQPTRTAVPTAMTARLEYFEKDFKEEVNFDLFGGIQLLSSDQAPPAQAFAVHGPGPVSPCLTIGLI
jgi:hypothetical protein